MSTLDQLQRSVERLNRAVERLSGGMGKYGFANVYNDDVQLLLSERAELLATVERLRVALERIADPRNIHFAGDAQVVARAALTTGEEK